MARRRPVHRSRRQVQPRPDVRRLREGRPAAAAVQTIARTETPDPETLVIHTKEPDTLIPARLAFCGQMVPWTYIDRVGFAAFNQRPVGTGPLRFVSWTRGDRCVLEANPDYWDGRLDVDRVVFRPVTEAAARVEALLRGDADLITRLTPDHTRARGVPSVHTGGRGPLRRPLRAHGQRLGAAAERPARPAGAVAGDRPGDDREGALARTRPRAERADPPGRRSPRPRAAAASLRPERGAGSAPAGRVPRRAHPLETTDGFIANDGP